VRGCDGVTIQWFASIEEFWGFCSEPEYLELIAPDERAFLSHTEVQWVIVEDPIVVIGEAGAGGFGSPWAGSPGAGSPGFGAG
jgi:hypothetical protein